MGKLGFSCNFDPRHSSPQSINSSFPTLNLSVNVLAKTQAVVSKIFQGLPYQPAVGCHYCAEVELYTPLPPEFQFLLHQDLVMFKCIILQKTERGTFEEWRGNRVATVIYYVSLTL